ncbi:magnesium transporter [Solimonas sp. K1W22B-7]|uniref:magnesium transporter n=1 Tax=Solimonas sp. K1W22B-7 TaxID=2303331 RepID=UPI000E32E080|nr:magnesium transporter [Solimonas sp. K1W22B-7]AXQ27323.1 magnesium transporter [Solimonas sp. K1W22B-7]
METSPHSLTELVRAARTRVPLDAAQLLGRESAETVAAVLGELPPQLAGEIEKHLPQHLRPDGGIETTTEIEIPGTVAEMMETASGVLDAQATVADAVAYLRAHDNPQQITYLYVTRAGRLAGMVVIRDLLLAEPQDTLASVMLPDPFALTADMEAGEAIKAAIYRHYPVYPVVDAEGKLAGIVRGWKLFERQAIEISAQSGTMVGLDKEERVQTPLWQAFRQRHPWLQINLLTAFLAAFVVGAFEDTISKVVALAAFLPVLAGQSGNNGCQTLAITLRGLTLGDMDGFPLRKLLVKEVMLGGLNGFLTGIVAGAAMWWTAARSGNEQAPLLGAVILAAMTGACMVSGFFGVMVPLTLRRFGADPATASSIFLTTGTDIAGMGLMLTLAAVFVL